MITTHGRPQIGNSQGWIKLHRSVLDGGWLRRHNLWVFWTYCLLKASHKEHKVLIGSEQVLLSPGQFVFGRRVASEETGLTERSIRTCLDSLKKMGNLTIKSTSKFSIVTVEKWRVYQGNDNEPPRKLTNDRPITDHIQERMNGRKAKDFTIIADPIERLLRKMEDTECLRRS